MNINFRKNNLARIPHLRQGSGGQAYQQKILNKVIDYYHKTFLDDQKLINYLVNEIGPGLRSPGFFIVGAAGGSGAY